METSDDLASWDRNGRALGLFAMSHMDYEVELNIHCGSLMAINFRVHTAVPLKFIGGT